MKKIINLLNLFYIFSIMGIQMLGNLITMIPIIENELIVKRKLITKEDIIDAITIGRCGPGAAIINTVAFIGNKLGGFLGGIFATFGFCLFPFLLILLIYFSIDLFINNEIINNFLLGVSTCLCVVIINSMIDFGKKTLKSRNSYVAFVTTLLLSIICDIPAIIYLLIWGIYGAIVEK